MRGSEGEGTLERLENGSGCEAEGCLEAAVWLVTLNDESSHWCAKHTRAMMRDAGGRRLVGPALGA